MTKFSKLAIASALIAGSAAASAATFGVEAATETVKQDGVRVTASAARAFVEAPVAKNLVVEAGVSAAHARASFEGVAGSENGRALDVAAKYSLGNGFNVKVGSVVTEIAGVSDTQNFASAGYDHKLGSATVAKFAVAKLGGIDGVVPSVAIEHDLSKNIRVSGSVSKAEGISPVVGLGVAYRF